MKPTRNHFGIIGPIPQERVRAGRDQGQDHAPTRCSRAWMPSKVKPRVMTLTQSTYDGVIYNTETIKNMLDGYVDTLHFDEAWLPHAAFHPFYGTYHAMGKKPRAAEGVAGVRDPVHPQAAGRHQPGQPRAGAGLAEPQAGPRTCSTRPT